MPSPQKIVLDTNFILIPAQLGIDIFEQIREEFISNYELYIIDKTIKELEKIGNEQKGRLKQQIKLTLSLIKAKNIKTLRIPSENGVDDILKDLAKEGYVIATADKELKQAIGHNVLYLRQKKTLERTI